MSVMETKLNENVILGNSSVQIVLISFMIAAVTVELLFIIFKDRVAVFRGSQLFKRVYRIMYVIGLIIFCISGCILDLFQVIARIKCDQVWRSCDHEMYRSYVIDVMFHLTKIIYLFSSVLFTLVFYRSKFKNPCLVRYGLMFLVGDNFDDLVWSFLEPITATHEKRWSNGAFKKSHNILLDKSLEPHVRSITQHHTPVAVHNPYDSNLQDAGRLRRSNLLSNRVSSFCFDHWAFRALASRQPQRRRQRWDAGFEKKERERERTFNDNQPDGMYQGRYWWEQHGRRRRKWFGKRNWINNDGRNRNSRNWRPRK